MAVDVDVRQLVIEYVTSVSEHRFERFEELLHPDVEFGGMAADLRGAGAVAAGYRRLGPILVRNDIKELVVDGDTAFVLYDFVTDTDAGAVLTGEFLRIADGRIRAITLLFDWRRWPDVMRAVEERAAQAEPADV
jgi:SnoaL-like domain